MRRILLSLLGLTLLIGCSVSSDSTSNRIRDALQSIPFEHRERIDALFNKLVRKTPGAYTLFGCKPWSIEVYRHTLSKFPFELSNADEIAFVQGWESWQAYGHLFPSNNFFLRRVSLSNHPDVWYFTIINKQAIISAIKRHQNIFQKVLNTQDPAEEIWAKMEESDEYLTKGFDHNHIMGILLGFGEANAQAFSRRTDLCDYLNQSRLPPFQTSPEIENLSTKSGWFVDYLKNYTSKSLFIKTLEPSPGFGSLAEELNYICESADLCEFCGPEILLDYFIPPQFMALQDNPDTVEKNATYKKTREELAQLIEEEFPLEQILTQWTYGRPHAP